MIRITDHRDDRIRKAYDFGVWEGERPRGRITVRDDRYLAYTNKRGPSDAYLGSYATVEEAAAAVVAA